MNEPIPVEVMLMAQGECGAACANEPDLEQRCRKAMRSVAKGYWMLAGDGPREQDMRFRGAIAAVLLDPLTTEEDKTKIKNTLNQLRALSAMMSGLPMDLEAMVKQQEENPPLPLSAWWREVRAEEGVK